MRAQAKLEMGISSCFAMLLTMGKVTYSHDFLLAALQASTASNKGFAAGLDPDLLANAQADRISFSHQLPLMTVLLEPVVISITQNLFPLVNN
jgi:hypothetical protein